VAAKFLVLWRLEVNRVSPEMMRALLRQQDYGKRLEGEGKIEGRYHIVGRHGGAWIYSVDSHEELDQLLAKAPVYNFSTYEVYALAEMPEEPTLLAQPEG
jgi:muconolactone delta-isomerase